MLLARRMGLQCVLMVALTAPVAVCAESMTPKRGVPTSLPPALTVDAVHSTGSTTVITFAEHQRDSLAWLTTRPLDPSYKEAPYACKADSVVCYDYRKRQSVMPATRAFMPEVRGLTKEGLTVKRDRVAFSYSF